jgi:hypothetical protein
MTPQEARDEIMALFVAGWSSTGIDLRFWNAPGPLPKDRSPWARILVKHTQGGNASISSKRFMRSGVIFVEIYTPVGGGFTQADDLAKIAMDVFQGKSTPGGVWFRNVRLVETDAEGHWSQVNVIADFTYDEVLS